MEIAPNLGGMTTGKPEPNVDSPDEIGATIPSCFASVDELVESRHKDYGHPTVNLPCIAKLWTVYQKRRNGAAALLHDNYDELDVCVYNILQKISRIANDPTKIDSWDDIQGYAECAKKCLASNEGS